MKTINDMNALLMSGVESAAQMSVGQAVLKLVDRILWIIEKSVQWSLPNPEITADPSVSEENGKSFGKVELVRPLPWIVFLPSLLFLRMVRFSLNTGAYILGYPEVQPSDMVRVIQRGRRRIRSIKSSGLKSMRQKKNPQTTLQKDRTMTIKEASKSLVRSMRLTLSTLSCLDSRSKTSHSPPPTKIRVSNILDTESPIMHRKLENEATLLKNLSKVERKRNYSELSSDAYDDDSDDETLINKLNRLANDSGSDRDFSPAECPSSETSVTSESEADVSIPINEVQELKAETEDMDKAQSYKVEDANTKCDDELHKLRNRLKFEIPNGAKQSEANKQIEEAAVPKEETNSENEQLHVGLTNGVGNDVDAIYFSPISWKSVSPELSVSPDKQDNQINNEDNSEDLSNGEVENQTELKDTENDNPCIEVGTEVTNGHSKEKSTIASQNSNNNKYHQQKYKRGNHSNRKKK